MQKIFVLILIIALPLFYYFYFFQGNTPLLAEPVDADDPVVHVGNVPIRVEIADSPSERSQGLSNRRSLGETNGMLFIFDTVGYPSIWMKDMQFAIDVIWIDESLHVVDITRDLRPDTFPRKFEPVAPVRYAIEVNSNYAASFGIAIGDEVDVPSSILPTDLQN